MRVGKGEVSACSVKKITSISAKLKIAAGLPRPAFAGCAGAAVQ
jgi:hypothetical protein